MEKRQLGKTELTISPIVLGAWALGGWMWGGTDEKSAVETIQASLEAGINTIDTAAVYGMGLSEELVAKAIKGKRSEVVIATKCGMRWDSEEGAEPWPQKDNSGKDIIIRKNSKPESIVYECERSLERLQVETIDLYQIHWPDTTTSIEESWKAMADLKKSGKVRAIGVCNYSLEQLKQAHAVHPVDCVQSPFSLVRRSIEKDIIPFCLDNKIGIIAYSPLERGLLTGKVTLERSFPEGDHRKQHGLYTQENRKKVLEALEKIKPIATKYQATLAEIIIHCTYKTRGITAAIVGARTAAQAWENAKAALLNLSESDSALVNAICQEVTFDSNSFKPTSQKR